MKKIICSLLILCTIFLVSCGSTESTSSNSNTNSTASSEDTTTNELISIESINTDKGIYESYDEETTVTFDASSTSYTITEAGTYMLTGTITETVVIDVDDEDVRLILNNVTIETTIDSAILVLSADDVEISVPEGTINYLIDSNNYSETNQEYNSVIYSEADLVINGSGTLNVEANYNNGILTKDDLMIFDVTLSVTSVDDGIIGRDSLYIQNATVSVDSEGDALKSTYTSDDDTITDKGYIYIQSGEISLTSGDEGIQATSDIYIAGGSVSVISESKGIKSDTSIYVLDGNVSVNSEDDAFHTDTNLEISGGVLTIDTNDDALHSDNYLTISNGEINIVNCYEGIEGKNITITGGNITIVANDDGINGSDPDIDIADAPKPNEPTDTTLSTATIDISGGVLLIDSDDDSIDSNGVVNISGGVIVINGPSTGTQSAVDYDLEWNLTGGTLIAVAGYGNETKTPSEGSTQVSFMYNTQSFQAAGTQVSLLDEDGTVIVSFTPTKVFQAILISTPDLDNSTTYSLCLNGTIDGELVNGYYSNATLTNYSVLDTFELDDVTNTFNAETTTIGGPPGRR